MAAEFDIEIRGAGAGDAAAVAALIGELGYSLTAEAIARKIEALEHAPRDRMLVACVGERVVGFAHVHCVTVFHRPRDLARLTVLIINEEWRSRGTGGMLVRAAEEFALRSGCGRIELVSGAQRKDAHRFYERLGYQVEACRFVKNLE